MKKTVRDIRESKLNGNKLTMLTAYDATMASLFSQCDIDLILVGDSLGMVVMGLESTVSVSMEDMIHHTRSVRRGAPEAFIVTDMPYGSCEITSRQAVENGVRLLKEAHCDMVKVEGGTAIADTVRRMTSSGVPVMGHIGLTPQTASQLGGYKVQGKELESAQQLVDDAKSLQESGASCVLMECVPSALASLITDMLTIPTIGIGAGPDCGGQVLVGQDMLGMFEKFSPKFVKRYCDLAPVIKQAVTDYCSEVRSGQFPSNKQSFDSDPDLYKQLKF